MWSQGFATHRLRMARVEDQEVTVTGINYMLSLQHRQEVSSPDSPSSSQEEPGNLMPGLITRLLSDKRDFVPVALVGVSSMDS